MAGEYRAEVEPARPANGDAPSIGPVYRNVLAKDGFPTLENATTLWENFSTAAQKFGERNMLGTREIVDGKAGDFKWLKYGEVFQQANHVGSAMKSVGLQPGGRVGIYGANSAPWMIAMQGCSAQSLYCVPLYDTLGADAIEFIINHAEVEIAFIQETKFKGFLSVLPKCPTLKTIVSMGNMDAETNKALADGGLGAYTWTEFLVLGAKNPAQPTLPKPEDLCTIMYTSGTTGDPKGVMLTHGMVVTMVASLKQGLDFIKFKMDENDVFLSYLPLAHIFDRASEEFMISCGASIGYWQGDVKLLVDDIGALKPTFFVGVPRIFDRIYQGVTSKVAESGFVKKFLFNFAYNRKLNSLKAGRSSEAAAPLMDKIVFNTVKGRLGGRVRLILSGAAPLARHVEEFLKVAMCAPVIQGYGLTESCAGSFVAYPNVISMTGTVGPPFPNVEVRLESVPEMGYDALATPPRGEVCLRGPCIFQGYYKREDLTKECMIDGWFHTGDVGEWQSDGALRIIDRKKNIFKLSQGEYVAVENLENVFGQTKGVDSVWVYGNSFESSLVAVVVPNEAALKEWAASSNVAGDFAEICANPDSAAYVMSELNATGKRAKLKGFELIRGVILDPLPFDVERDLLTPTFKKKRPQLLKHYQAQIDDLYKKVNAAAPKAT